MPIAFDVGGRDASVPPHSVLRLAGILKELKRLVRLTYHEDGGHSTSYDDTMRALDFVIESALKQKVSNLSERPGGHQVAHRAAL